MSGALAPCFEIVETSFLAHDRADVAGLVVVIDGWGDLGLREAVRSCRRRFSRAAVMIVVSDHDCLPIRQDLAGVVVWPATSTELVGKAQALLRALDMPRGARVVLDASRLTLECNDVFAGLTSDAFAVVRHLIRQAPQWCARDSVIGALPASRGARDEGLAEVMRELRQNLGHEGWRLCSHPRYGYRFDLNCVAPLPADQTGTAA